MEKIKMIRKLLYSLGVILMWTCASTMFTACSSDDDPEENNPVKEAQVIATLYVNQNFVEAFDVKAQTLEGEELMLSSETTLVNVFGTMVPMYYLTIDDYGNSLPVTNRILISYVAKDLDNKPESRDYIIAAESYGFVSYKDGRVVNQEPHWYFGRYKQEYLDWGFKDDVDTYLTHVNERFSELYTIYDDWCFRFTTNSRYQYEKK